MTALCIGCGLDVDETGRLIVPRSGGGDEAAFPAGATAADNALQCDPDSGLWVGEHFSDASRTAEYFTVNTPYEASTGTSQIIGGIGAGGAMLGVSCQSHPARVTYCMWVVTVVADIVNFATDYNCIMEVGLGHDPLNTFPGTMANAAWQVGGNAISGRSTIQGTQPVSQDNAGGNIGSAVQPVPGIPLAAGADDLMLNVRVRADFHTTAGGLYVNSIEIHIGKIQVTDGLTSRAAAGAVIA